MRIWVFFIINHWPSGESWKAKNLWQGHGHGHGHGISRKTKTRHVNLRLRKVSEGWCYLTWLSRWTRWRGQIGNQRSPRPCPSRSLWWVRKEGEDEESWWRWDEKEWWRIRLVCTQRCCCSCVWIQVPCIVHRSRNCGESNADAASASPLIPFFPNSNFSLLFFTLFLIFSFLFFPFF